MKFTRLPKIPHLVALGVPVEAIPTYAALSDYTNNKTGLCWPKMETLAVNLGRSVRTVQRHLHQLQGLGLVEFVERRRWRGRFSGYTYRVLHIAALIRRRKAALTTGHGRPVGSGPPIVTGTKATKTPPVTPPMQGYDWLVEDRGDPTGEKIIKKVWDLVMNAPSAGSTSHNTGPESASKRRRGPRRGQPTQAPRLF